jgi:WD40 repeat protein
MATYDAFISYSHAADRLTAHFIQKGLENCNRRWLGRRRLRVFRDETDLSVAPSLWGVVEQALDSSRFFILLASPEAARSKWVSKEISHWTKTKSPAAILLVVTDGSYGWDDEECEFNRAASSAIPPALFGLFSEEPLFLDLRGGPLRKRSRPEQQRAIATLAAPIHGKSKEELLGLEVQLYRRRLLITVLAFALVAVLAAGFFWQATEAGRQRDEAGRQRDEARRQRDTARVERNHAQSQLLATRSMLALRQERASPAFWLAVEAWTTDSNWGAQKALYDFARSGLRSTFEHGSLVSDAAISRSGTYVATAGVGLKVWKADGTLVFSAGSKAVGLAFADFAPDESCVAYGLAELTVVTLSGKPEFELPTKSMAHAGFSPDSRFLLTAAYRQPIQRWNRKGQILTEYRHESDVSSLSVSRDGSRIAAGTAGGDVKLWTVDGAVLGSFRDREEVISVEFSPDGSQVMSLTRNGSLTVRSIEGGAGKVIANQGVLAAAISPQGTQVAALFAEGAIRLLDFSGRTLQTLEGSLPVPAELRVSDPFPFSFKAAKALQHLTDRRPGFTDRRPGSICFAGNGRLLVASAGDTTQVWDIEMSRLLKNTTKGGLLSVSPDGHYLVTHGEYSALLWELDPGAGAVVRCESVISDVALAPKGGGFVTASLDGKARLWNANGQVTATLAHGAPVMSASFSHDGQTVLTVGRNSVARLWSRTGGLLRDFPHAEIVHYAAFSPDDRRIVTTAADGTAALWSTEGQKLAVLNHKGEVYHAAFSPDGRFVATAAADRMVRVWTQAGALSWEGVTTESVQKVAFSADGQRVVAVTTGNELSIFESGSGHLVARLKHPDELITADVAPTGNIVITSAADRVVRVWDMDGSLLAKIDHVEPVRSVCVSRDGMRVLTASEDGYARLWDLNGNELFVFSDAAPLKQAVFATDGHRVLTISAHSVRVWDFGSPESIIARYGKTVGKFSDETTKEGS